MDAARALHESRAAAGLTQAALARRAGTSQAAISAYETGSKQPSVLTLTRLLAAAGARLTFVPAALPRPPRISEARLVRAGELLVAVLALAEALPVRHEQVLRFPRLDR